MQRSPLTARDNVLMADHAHEISKRHVDENIGDARSASLKDAAVIDSEQQRSTGLDNWTIEGGEMIGRESDLLIVLEAVASPQSFKYHGTRKEKVESQLMDVINNPNLRGGDVHLQAALKALDTVQQFAANRTSSGQHDGNQTTLTPGQQLALFLKDQLVLRQEARVQAEEKLVSLTQSLAEREAELTVVRKEATVYKVRARQADERAVRAEQAAHSLATENSALKAELHEAQKLADSTAEVVQRLSAELEISKFETRETAKVGRHRIKELEDRASLALRLQMMPGAAPAAAGIMPDDFRQLRGETIKCIAANVGFTGEEASPPSPDVFASVEVNSVAESDDTLSEAEAEIRGTAVFADSCDDASASLAVKELAEQRRERTVSEERVLRSEIATLERKCERAEELVTKSNQAMQVLQFQLQREHKQVAELQEEKRALQSQLLAALDRPQGINPDQLSSMMMELSQCRDRIEALCTERTELMTRLKTGERRLVDAQRQAAEALETEHVRAESLARRVEELTSQLSEATETAARVALVDAALDEARSCIDSLAAELEMERSTVVHKDSELARVAEVAQSLASDLMAAREDAAAERAAQERLTHENAGLKGREEALREALERLERDDGVVESLAEGHAQLHSRLRQAETAATGARTALEAVRTELDCERRRADNAERVVGSLRTELEEVETRRAGLHAASLDAADQLTSLTSSHEALQRELEAVILDAQAAREETRGLSQRVLDAETRAQRAENALETLRQSMKDASERQNALSKDLTGSVAELAALRQEVCRLQGERDDALGRINRLEAAKTALTAEREALRHAGAMAEGTNQTLVDNMCEMTGLIDAIAALQERARILEEEADAAAAKAVRAAEERDSFAFERAATERDLARERERLQAETANSNCLREALDAIRGEHAVVVRRLQEEERAHAVLSEKFAALETQHLETRAAATAAHAEATRLRFEIERLTAALTDAHALTMENQGKLRAVITEKEAWLAAEHDLKDKLSVSEKARGLAEGKLVLSRQREEQMKVAASDLHQLQMDLTVYLAEFEALRQEKEGAEDRCAELTGRCMVLLDQMAGLEAAAEAAEREVVSQKEAKDAMEQELHTLQTHLLSLSGALEALPPLHSELDALRTQHQEGEEWCDGLSAELVARNKELVVVREDAESARRACEHLQAALQEARAGADAAVLEAAQSDAERQKAVAALEETQDYLASCLNELERAKAERSSTLEALASAQSSVDALSEAKERCEASEAALKTAEAAHESLEAALLGRIAELETHNAAHAQQAEVAHRRVSELQAAVEASSSACAALVSKVEAATEEHRIACEERSNAQAAVEALSEKLQGVEHALADTKAALSQVSAAKDSLEATAAERGRAAELLEVQCDVLRRQIGFLENAHAQDADLSTEIRQQLHAAYDEQRGLREKLADGARAIEERQREMEMARQQAADAELKAAAAQEMANRVAAELRALRASIGDSQRQTDSLRQQLELSELLKDQAMREADVAREATAAARSDAQRAQEAAEDAERRRMAAVSESELALRDAWCGLSAQADAIGRAEAAVVAALSANAPPAVALREVADAMESVAANVSSQDAAMSLGTWAMVAASKETMRQKLGDLQRGLAQLAAEHASRENAAEISAAAAEAREASWRGEKVVLRAVCKLALAVTMDQVACAHNFNADNTGVNAGMNAILTASHVAADLEPIVTEHIVVMEALGLDSVWTSLRRLARSSSASRQAAATEVARLGSELDELRTHTAVVETVADDERRRADRAEAALCAEAARVQEMLGSLRWATGDVDGLHCENQTIPGGTTPGEEMAMCVDALSAAVRRVVRRYRLLSRIEAPTSAAFGAKVMGTVGFASSDDEEVGSCSDDVIPAHLGQDDEMPLRTKFRFRCL